MIRVEALIFDLDGVLVDTAKYHYLAWQRLAGELGFDFTKEQNERLKGVSRMRSLAILLEIGGLKVEAAEQEALASRKNAWYLEYITKMDEAEVLEGVTSFLLETKAQGLKIALGSASKNAELILQQVGLKDYFDVLVDGNMVRQAKPDPEVFLLASALLKVDPRHCVVFEDAKAGIEAAKRGNMRAIGVGDAENLKEASFVIPGFSGVTLASLLAKL